MNELARVEQTGLAIDTQASLRDTLHASLTNLRPPTQSPLYTILVDAAALLKEQIVLLANVAPSMVQMGVSNDFEVFASLRGTERIVFFSVATDTGGFPAALDDLCADRRREEAHRAAAAYVHKAPTRCENEAEFVAALEAMFRDPVFAREVRSQITYIEMAVDSISKGRER